MKRTLFLCLCALPLFITLTSGIINESGRAGYTGSPGEVTCNTSSCHNSFALNSGGGSVSATSTMINWIYEPLTTYTINIKVAKTGVHLFGFGVEILNLSNNNAGTIIVTNAVKTQLKSRFISGVIRRNIVHQLNGGASPDSVIFSFDWTSPDTTSGAITMYFVGNASNQNGSVTGDYIYSSSLLITPVGGNKVDNIVSVSPFSVYPSPANTSISLHYYLQKNENVEVKLYDMQGTLAYLLMKADHTAGENNELISLPSECRSGLYLLSVESSSGRVNRKLMIN